MCPLHADNLSGKLFRRLSKKWVNLCFPPGKFELPRTKRSVRKQFWNMAVFDILKLKRLAETEDTDDDVGSVNSWESAQAPKKPQCWVAPRKPDPQASMSMYV